MPWKKGQSGNPSGRKSGSGEVAKLRASLKPHLPEVLNALAESAKAGDVQAIKLLIERAVPPHKPTTEPVKVPALLKAKTLTDKAQCLLEAIANGAIAPDVGGAMLSALGNVAKAVEIDDLTKRIEALEREE